MAELRCVVRLFSFGTGNRTFLPPSWLRHLFGLCELLLAVKFSTAGMRESKPLGPMIFMFFFPPKGWDVWDLDLFRKRPNEYSTAHDHHADWGGFSCSAG